MAFFCSFRLSHLIAGPRVDLVGTTKLPYGQIPVLLHNGEITLQTQSGKLASMALDTHAYLFIDAIEGKSQKEVIYCYGHRLSEQCLNDFLGEETFAV